MNAIDRPSRASIPCECGNRLDVAMAQAGSVVQCNACGALVEVPALSTIHQTASPGVKNHMQPVSGKTDANRRLLLAWLVYVGVNVLMVFLEAGGVVHPPWAVLTFFSFVGPLMMVGIVLFLGLMVVRFDKVVLVTFLIAMAATAVLNLLVFGHAVASV